MGVKVGSTQHLSTAGQLQNIASLDSTTTSTISAVAASASSSVVPHSVELLSASGYSGYATRSATSGTYYIAMGGHSGNITSAAVGTPSQAATVSSSSENSETHRQIFYKFT